jgi:hypothetical protein
LLTTERLSLPSGLLVSCLSVLEVLPPTSAPITTVVVVSTMPSAVVETCTVVLVVLPSAATSCVDVLNVPLPSALAVSVELLLVLLLLLPSLWSVLVTAHGQSSRVFLPDQLIPHGAVSPLLLK